MSLTSCCIFVVAGGWWWWWEGGGGGGEDIWDVFKTVRQGGRGGSGGGGGGGQKCLKTFRHDKCIILIKEAGNMLMFKFSGFLSLGMLTRYPYKRIMCYMHSWFTCYIIDGAYLYWNFLILSLKFLEFYHKSGGHPDRWNCLAVWVVISIFVLFMWCLILI